MEREIIDIHYNGISLDSIDTHGTQLVQNQANAYEFRFHFTEGLSVAEMFTYSCLINMARADGEVSNNVVCTPIVDDTENLYYRYPVGEWTTGVAGTLSITPKIKDYEGVEKTFGIVNLQVASSVEQGDGTITDEQYQALLNATNGYGALIGANLVKITEHTEEINDNREDISDLRKYVDTQTGNGGTDVSSAYDVVAVQLENLDLGALVGDTLFDGYAPVYAGGENPKVLLQGQTNPLQSGGIFYIGYGGFLSRPEYNVGDIVKVLYGDTQAGKYFKCNEDRDWIEINDLPGLPLQEQIDTAKGRITVNESDIASTKNRLDIVEPIVDSNTTRTTAVESKATNNETNIATNRADIDNNDIDIASNKSRLTATEGATSTNRTDIDKNSSDILLKEDKANKGIANGYAPLNASGKIDSSFVPNAYNDYIEVATYADLPNPGVTGNLYIVKNDETSGGDLSTYFWATDTYVAIHDTQSSTDIKVKYESNADTNAFTDSEKAKLLSLLTGTDYYSSQEVEQRLNDLLTLGILQDTLILAENGDDHIVNGGTIPASYLADYDWVYFKTTLTDDSNDHFGMFRQSEATPGKVLRTNVSNKKYASLSLGNSGVTVTFNITDEGDSIKTDPAECKFWGLKTTELSADLISTDSGDTAQEVLDSISAEQVVQNDAIVNLKTTLTTHAVAIASNAQAINNIEEVVYSNTSTLEYEEPEFTISENIDTKAVPVSFIANGLTVNQAIENGNFETIGNWYNSWGDTLSVTNNTLIATMTNTFDFVSIESPTTTSSSINHFCYAKVKTSGTGQTAIIGIPPYSTNSSETTLVANSFTYVHSIVSPFSSSNAYKITIHNTTIGDTIQVQEAMCIPMTGVIENYTEEQMLALAKQGYFEGLKSVSGNIEIDNGSNQLNVTYDNTNSVFNYNNGIFTSTPSNTSSIIPVSDYIFKANVTYTMKVYEFTETSVGNCVLFFRDINNNDCSINNIVLWKNGITFSCPSDSRLMIFWSETYNYNGTFNIMINKGTVAMPYTPYDSTYNPYTQDLGTLQSVGDIQDTHDLVTGKTTKNVAEYVFSASEPLENVDELVNVYRFKVVGLPSTTSVQSINIGIKEYYLSPEPGYSVASEHIYNGSDGRAYVFILKTVIDSQVGSTTKEKAQSWLSGKTLMYKLETPEIIDNAVIPPTLNGGYYVNYVNGITGGTVIEQPNSVIGMIKELTRDNLAKIEALETTVASKEVIIADLLTRVEALENA